MNRLKYLREFFYTLKILRYTRHLQEYLWGKNNDGWGFEEWKRMFVKRAHKIVKVDMNNPHWKIELRKRLIQNACLSISLLSRIDELVEGIHKFVPSNLDEYDKMTKKCEAKL